jgi:hypothetical protein
VSLFASLSAEWAQLACSVPMSRALQRWAEGDSRLAFATAAELVAAVEARDDRCHDVLAALAALAPTDDLAARTLLQLLMPALCGVARRLRFLGDHDERASAVVAIAYERIRTYPIKRRPRHIAANLVWDTTKRLLATAPPRQATGTQLTDQTASLPVEMGEPSTATDELMELLTWAQRHGHLSADSAELIALTRVADVPAATLAPRFGRDAQVVRRRRQRAEGALKAAVLAAA